MQNIKNKHNRHTRTLSAIKKGNKMAYPRVFISSTCYDLREIRDTLFSFIDEMNYIPVLSDKGDVFYHPDIHTHDSCIHEIETCQLFILIIGGRFGGAYKANPEKSIVNAEYEAAKNLDLPIVTFISREVYEDHRLYVKNRKVNPDTFQDIFYPSMENQSYAVNIFEFIDSVRKSEFNNAVFPFDFGRDIRTNLKQQWAGMFYDFLRFRKSNKQYEKTNHLLSDLTMISEKTEEILGNIYEQVDKENAGDKMKNIENIYNSKKLFILLKKTFEDFSIKSEEIDKYCDFDKKLSFDKYLISTGVFNAIKDSFNNKDNPELNRYFNSLLYRNDIGYGYLMISGDLNKSEFKKIDTLKKLYSNFKTLNKTDKIEVLKGFIE